MMKMTNTLSYYRNRAEEARIRAENATDPSIREFFATLSQRYHAITANLVRARRPTLSLRLSEPRPKANRPEGPMHNYTPG
jgi:hypothetical protein